MAQIEKFNLISETRNILIKMGIDEDIFEYITELDLEFINNACTVVSNRASCYISTLISGIIL